MVFTITNRDGSLIEVPDNTIIHYQGLKIQGDNLTDWNEPLEQNAVYTINKVLDTIDSLNALTSRVDNLTKSNVGLGNVDNTSDLSKPISTATQLALDNLYNSIATSNVASGASTFTDLTDVPDSYIGNEGKLIRIKADGTGLEFFNASAGSTTVIFNNATNQSVIDLRPLANIAYKVDLDIHNIIGYPILNFMDSTGILNETINAPVIKSLSGTDFTNNITLNGSCTITITIYYKF